MKLSPLLIKKQEFEKSMRGYNVDEVQAFLENVASQMEQLLNQKEALEAEVKKLNERVNEYQRIERNLQDTLIKAREDSAKTLDAARNQTNQLIVDAKGEASKILQSARKNAEDIRNAVMNLREEKNLIIARLKAIITTQANLLEGKVKEAGAEKTKPAITDEGERLDIDVDGIVDKLL